jgi:SAM-dependent methyltransferase
MSFDAQPPSPVSRPEILPPKTIGQGSAQVQRKLWAVRPGDWSHLIEPTFLPLYESVLDRLAGWPIDRLLDVGCGAGLFCQMASRQVVQVAGIDATPEMLQIAMSRTPMALFEACDMEQLPFANGTFDAVTGFNSFQFAADPLEAVREARRVTRQGGKMVIAVWGPPEVCELSVYLEALAHLMPPPPVGAPGAFALSKGDALERLLLASTLKPLIHTDVDCPWVFASADRMTKALLSPGQAAKAIQYSGEAAVAAAILRAMEPFRLPNGGYRLRNRMRYIVAEV